MVVCAHRFRIHGFILLGCLAAAPIFAAEPSPSRAGQGEPLGYGEAAVLGLVEGLTEFLPVSSTGHLIIANRVLGLDRDEQARDPAGNPLWVEPPSATAGAGEPFTVKAAADNYAVVIQAGAILAVAILYWGRIVSIFAGMFGRDPAGLRLLRNLIVAFLPAAVLGLALDDFIDERLFSVRVVIAALVVGSGVMFVVNRWQRRKSGDAAATLPDPLPSDLTVKQALIVGLMQCCALWPGMSRSMMTLVGGYLVGLRPARSAEFTFLLGLVTLSAASIYKGWGSGALMVKAFGMAPLLLGGLVAAISAGLAVHWMVGYLTRHGLALFAWYRLGLAAAVWALLV